MIKTFKIILLLILLSLAFFYKEEVINFINKISKLKNKYLLVLFVFFLFFIPFISTFLILANSMIFGENSFLISYIFLIFSSIMTYLIIKKFKNNFLLKIRLKSNFEKVFKKSNKFYNSDYTIFLSRYIIPPFVHNCSYGLVENVKTTNFFVMIALAEIPVVLTLNSIGKSLYSFDHIQNSTINIIYEQSFYLPTIFLFLMILIVKFVVKKIYK